MLPGRRLAIPGAKREPPSMPRRLDSVNTGGYVEAIEVDESELEAVLGMLGITDARKAEAARNRVYRALEDLATAHSHTAKAKPIREDLRDLEKLHGATNPEVITAPLQHAIEAIESIRSDNPVVYKRLKSLFSNRQLHESLSAMQDAEEAIFAIGRNFSEAASKLTDEIRSEDGRGRPRDDAAFKFARSLHRIWRDFTGRSTSRQNTPDGERNPFGDFVEAAGKLIERDFYGQHVARQAHDAHRKQPDGEN